ncbi:hypothetical protein M9H77_17212 [Catharanthus roseus]|uniref:Uncharacterized protein n=1 Tax=Catharanthus roseus TaxID=4058 RepID=A0ACC0B3Z9_CATRO|nr:hypothetical protein M9H77_17212 [Catharanthus roseus]
MAKNGAKMEKKENWQPRSQHAIAYNRHPTADCKVRAQKEETARSLPSTVGWKLLTKTYLRWLIMSMETQLPTHYNERISGSSHCKFDPMKVIMQELELMRKDMKKMRGNITNLSMEHRDQNSIGGHARSYEHNSYDYYEGNRLGAINCYNDTSCKKVPRNEVRNGENYVKWMKGSIKNRGDTVIVMIIISTAM